MTYRVHTVDVDVDEEGWAYAACDCGWRIDGLPDRGTAVDCIFEHGYNVGRVDGEAGT